MCALKTMDTKDLLAAANLGNYDDAKAALDGGVDVNKRNKKGKTAFSCASGNGHLDIVQLLLERGANPLIKNEVSFSF